MSERRATPGDIVEGPEIPLPRLVRIFEIHNLTEGKSPATVKWYNDVLGLFIRWFEEEGRSTALGDISEMDVREYILHLQERPGVRGKTSSHTVSNRVRAIRAFFAWLARAGFSEDHLLKNLKVPKTSERIVEPLTKEEVESIFARMNTKTMIGSRNTALLSLMLDTGIRLSETAGLVEGDVHIEDRYIKVMGKGSKERLVAFGAACQRALLDYLYRHRGQPAHQGVVSFFLSIDGYSLTIEAIKSLMDRLAVSSGITRLHPHLLRHTYATWFLLNGGDVFLLKQNLGHKTLAMVEYYIHMASRDVAIRSQSFSPLDGFGVQGGRRYRHPSSAIREPGGIYPQSGLSEKRPFRTRRR
jgi:integrase/recombinase XerC/integrase/recombinase XerD